MVPFVGPSYNLATREASVQRSVNLFLVAMEAVAKSKFILQSVPGLAVFAEPTGEIRGGIEAAGRVFIVAGSTLYEYAADGTATARGTLATATGPVDLAWGTTQLVIVDGLNGYVLTLASNAFGIITSTGWLGSDRVGFLDGYFIFSDPGTQQFYISAIDDATSLDALDFASAESAPDDIVAHLVAHREAWFFGETTTEVWFNSGATDFPFSRNNGSTMEVGCVACFSAQKIDNGAMWIGRDTNGSGIVYRAIGYQPQRVSTVAVEEALQASTDISQARAYVYQMSGQTFYCINAPGVDSTWCYEVSTGAWHERCDVDAVTGELIAHRAKCHVFGHSLHLVGGDDGIVYRMDQTVNTFNGDQMPRIRISPNNVTPMREHVPYHSFALDCSTGHAPQGTDPQVALSWSDNGGFTWGNPVQRTLGAAGHYMSRVFWTRLGMARDRVWRVEFTEDAPFSIISAESD